MVKNENNQDGGHRVQALWETVQAQNHQIQQCFEGIAHILLKIQKSITNVRIEGNKDQNGGRRDRYHLGGGRGFVPP